MIKYMALSMQEIADLFDENAKKHAQASDKFKTAKAKQMHNGMSLAWTAAARFIEKCEIIE